MSDPVYTDDELITSYRQAKNKSTQIGILADTRGWTREQMRRHLMDLGCDVPNAPGRKNNRGRPREPIDELRAMALYQEGYNDVQIADAIGVPQTRITNWRKRMRLPGIRKKRPGPAAAADCESEKEETMKKDSERNTVKEDTLSEVAEPADTILEDEIVEPAETEAAEEAKTVHGGGWQLEKVDKPMTVSALAKVLQKAAEVFPDATVSVNDRGSRVYRAGVTVDYDENGDVCEVNVLLFT